jgi:predicted nucleotidyltransferase
MRPVDLSQYIEAWRERQHREIEARAHLSSELRGCLPALARLLRDRFHVRQVSVVGSVARGDVHPGSDIDLLVEGLDDADLFDAQSEAERLAGRPVDLIRMEDLSPRTRACFMRESERIS